MVTKIGGFAVSVADTRTASLTSHIVGHRLRSPIYRSVNVMKSSINLSAAQDLLSSLSPAAMWDAIEVVGSDRTSHGLSEGG